MLGSVIAKDLCVNANAGELVGEFVNLLKDNWNDVCRVCFIGLHENRHGLFLIDYPYP